MHQIKIEDKRGNSEADGIVDSLNNVISHITPEYMNGVRRIVLLDRDYHQSNSTVRGRYVQLGSSKRADIEIYVETLLAPLSESLKNEEIFIAYQLAVIVMHELYHHSIRGLNIRRYPKKNAEEKQANSWAIEESTKLLHEMFPAKKFMLDYERITRARREYEENGAGDDLENGSGKRVADDSSSPSPHPFREADPAL